MQTIGDSAFAYCSSLANVTFPSSLRTLSSGAFYNCSSLTSATLNEGLTSIGLYAFRFCTSLTTATIPSTVTSLGVVTFIGCSSLATVDCYITKTVFDASPGAANAFIGLTLNLRVRSTDSTWTTGAGQSIGGGTINVTANAP